MKIMQVKRLKKPNEYDLQLSVCNYLKLQYPSALFSSDLGGVKLGTLLARKMAAIRKIKGHPDLTIYEPRGPYYGLFLELKQDGVKLQYKAGQETRNGRLNEHQVQQYNYMLELKNRGFACSFAVGFEDAKNLIDAYLDSYIYFDLISKL